MTTFTYILLALGATTVVFYLMRSLLALMLCLLVATFGLILVPEHSSLKQAVIERILASAGPSMPASARNWLAHRLPPAADSGMAYYSHVPATDKQPEATTPAQQGNWKAGKAAPQTAAVLPPASSASTTTQRKVPVVSDDALRASQILQAHDDIPRPNPAAIAARYEKNQDKPEKASDKKAASAEVDKKWLVQLGVFNDEENADKVRLAAAAQLGKGSIRQEHLKTAGGERFRLVAGPYKSREAASKAISQLKAHQINAILKAVS
jgi:cell division protein FtsN